MRPPPPLRNENSSSSAFVSSVAETIASAKAGEQQDQDVDVAQGAAAPDGEADHRGAGDEARDANGGELHGGAAWYRRPPHRTGRRRVSALAMARVAAITFVLLAAIASVAAAAPPWSAPQSVSSPSLFVDAPDVVVSADGRALATWRWSGAKPAQGDAPGGTRLAVREPGALDFRPRAQHPALRHAAGHLQPRPRGRARHQTAIRGADLAARALRQLRGRVRNAADDLDLQATPGPPSLAAPNGNLAAWIAETSERAPRRARIDQVERALPPPPSRCEAAGARTTSSPGRPWASCSSRGSAPAWWRRA